MTTHHEPFTRINAQLTAKQHAALIRVSKQTATPVAALIRQAIDTYLAKRSA